MPFFGSQILRDKISHILKHTDIFFKVCIFSVLILWAVVVYVMRLYIIYDSIIPMFFKDRLDLEYKIG
jgi:hypothetical protein